MFGNVILADAIYVAKNHFVAQLMFMLTQFFLNYLSRVLVSLS